MYFGPYNRYQATSMWMMSAIQSFSRRLTHERLSSISSMMCSRSVWSSPSYLLRRNNGNEPDPLDEGVAVPASSSDGGGSSRAAPTVSPRGPVDSVPGSALGSSGGASVRLRRIGMPG